MTAGTSGPRPRAEDDDSVPYPDKLYDVTCIDGTLETGFTPGGAHIMGGWSTVDLHEPIARLTARFRRAETAHIESPHR